ncbi:MAG: DUF6268 family outer membrane beta-barrel protein [Bacteroidota bacterium]
MKTILSTLITAFFFCQILSAQDVDLIGISYSYNPKVGLMNPSGPVLENADLDVSELKIKLLLPTQLRNGNTTIINSLEWHYVNAFFNQLPEAYFFDANLHSLQYTLGINQQLNEKWGFRVMAKPTLASNLKGGLSSDDFFMQGSAVIHRNIREGLTIGAGAAYINGFGEPLAVPILSLGYRTEKFDVDIQAPVNISAKYKTGNFMAGLQAGVDGNQYNLRLGDNEQPKVDKIDAINFSRYNVGPVFGCTIEGQGRIELSAGVSLNRIFKVMNVQGDELDYDLNNGFFVKTGFYFGK